MNGYERVFKASTFGFPDMIPLANGPDGDIVDVGYRPARDFQPQVGLNEWGCRWVSLNKDQGDQGQVAEHPLADWERSGKYCFPDPLAPGRFEHLAEDLPVLRRREKFILGHLGKGPMHLLDDLRGFENYLSDMLLNPDRVEWILDGIFNVLEGLTCQFVQLGVDAVIMADDQAMQSGPLFSMDLWRRHLKPRYCKLFNQAHDGGLLVYMHTCGNLSSHLVDLLESGVDVVDNKQPALWMNNPAVDAVRGRMAFSSCLDIQSQMQTVPLERIEAAVRHLIERLAVPGGGFICRFYDKPDLHLDQEKIQRMLRAIKTFRWK